ncbi:hypothetical protein B9Q01_01560 [Candidatus Marsarchaeota G1 archaeon OSP_D]|uniref:5'-deoxynucleotidase n=1 Tax=Candidatus Marsarchaeota G1 archaeon OSP_D TaxID=1978155 RepID=A0A2R6AD32_9ARCH|nr:MAG: hypothetical protein B9Q01_01560 [Candidatus Marsarchaeota G1 archaeon OSP_D]
MVRHLPDESVADHTFRTALLAMLLSDLIDSAIDKERVLRMALIHDLAECYVGDWDLETTNTIGKEVKKRVEETAIKKVLSFLPAQIASRYYHTWKEFEENSSKEAKIVHLADKLEAVMQAFELSKFGYSKSVKREFERNLESLELTQELKALLQVFMEEIKRWEK